MNLAQEVEQHGGLYAFTCSEMARKRATMLPVSGQWYAPTPKSVHKGKGRIVAPTPAYEPPVKPLKNLATINAVEEPEPEVSDDDMQELSLAPIPISAGDESEADEEGTVSEDATVNVDAE
jgi:alpha-glucosidase (family GH31 glycosyl hydrolase)